MRKWWGLTQSGDPSERSKENAAIDRKYAVTDFDFTLEGAFGDVDRYVMDKEKLEARDAIHEITARLIIFIAKDNRHIPLFMVLDTGKRASTHGGTLTDWIMRISAYGSTKRCRWGPTQRSLRATTNSCGCRWGTGRSQASFSRSFIGDCKKLEQDKIAAAMEKLAKESTPLPAPKKKAMDCPKWSYHILVGMTPTSRKMW